MDGYWRDLANGEMLCNKGAGLGSRPALSKTALADSQRTDSRFEHRARNARCMTREFRVAEVVRRGPWLLFRARVFLTRDPRPDVWRTVTKRDAVAFAIPQKPDGVSIHEDQVLEVQHEGPARPFRGDQRGELA